MKKVLVINFHRLCNNNSTYEGLKDVYSFDAIKFAAIVDFIKKQKIPVISLYDLITNSVKEEQSIALTFDDGNATDFSAAFPLLEASGLQATFFPTLSQIKKNQISWDQIIKMSESKNITIGSHGISHTRMTELTDNEVERELRYSKQFIEEKINKTVDFFSLPYGVWNNQVVELSKKAEYKAILTTNVKINHPELHPYIIHRWSPHSSTSVDIINKMITFNPVSLHRKIWTSRLKKLGKKILGDSLSEKLNQLY